MFLLSVTLEPAVGHPASVSGFLGFWWDIIWGAVGSAFTVTGGIETVAAIAGVGIWGAVLRKWPKLKKHRKLHSKWMLLWVFSSLFALQILIGTYRKFEEMPISASNSQPSLNVNVEGVTDTEGRKEIADLKRQLNAANKAIAETSLKKSAIAFAKQIQAFTRDWKDSDTEEIKRQNISRYQDKFGGRAVLIRDDLDRSGQQSAALDHAIWDFKRNYADVHTIASEIERLAEKLQQG